jgi:hypothetical protein
MPCVRAFKRAFLGTESDFRKAPIRTLVSMTTYLGFTFEEIGEFFVGQASFLGFVSGSLQPVQKCFQSLAPYSAEGC